MLPPAPSLWARPVVVGGRGAGGQGSVAACCWKLGADATWHPNDTEAGAFECFCASMMGHDSLSEMGRPAEPWKSLEGERA